MSRYKAYEVLRHEAYIAVRCNDEGRVERSRWAFFNNLSGFDVMDIVSHVTISS